MGDEWACRRSAGYVLQDRCLHLGVSVLVEELAHGAQHGGTLHERVFHAVVDDEVHVALAGAHLRVVELVVGHAVLVFHYRQRLEALREERQLLGVDGDLAGLCLEDETAYADDVANVEQLLEDHVVKVLVVLGADVVTGDVDLYAALAVLQLHEARLAHDAAAHHASGDDDLCLLVFLERLLDVRAER